MLSFKPESGEALHRQIARHIRLLIHGGNLPAGSKLPRMHDLAARWGTNYFTVHTALTGLVGEGLLERKPRLGTFVRKPGKNLKSVGIYYADEILTKHERAFYRSLHAQLMALLQKEKISNQVFIDCRPHDRQDEPLQELAQAVSSNTIQGLIVPLINEQGTAWLKNLPLPTSFFSNLRTSYSRICIDHHQIIYMACRALLQQGCRTVGLINPTPITELSGGKTPGDSIHNAFRSSVEALGLKTRKSWTRIPLKVPKSQERFGYEEFHQLWPQKERPDGVIVYPENASRGVALAVLERRVKIPTELKLVLHKNQNVDFLCPISASWVVTRERDIAEALIQQIKDRFAGLEPRSYDIRHDFVMMNEEHPLLHPAR